MATVLIALHKPFPLSLCGLWEEQPRESEQSRACLLGLSRMQGPDFCRVSHVYFVVSKAYFPKEMQREQLVP